MEYNYKVSVRILWMYGRDLFIEEKVFDGDHNHEQGENLFDHGNLQGKGEAAAQISSDHKANGEKKGHLPVHMALAAVIDGGHQGDRQGKHGQGSALGADLGESQPKGQGGHHNDAAAYAHQGGHESGDKTNGQDGQNETYAHRFRFGHGRVGVSVRAISMPPN